MKYRNVAAVAALTLVVFPTFSLYLWWWLHKTRQVLNAAGGRRVPTVWLTVLPIFLTVLTIIMFLPYIDVPRGQPPALFLFLPVIGLATMVYFYYQFSLAVTEYTEPDKLPALLTFILFMIAPYVGTAVLQSKFNQMPPRAEEALPPEAPVGAVIG